MTPEVLEIVGRKSQPGKLNDLFTKVKQLVKLSRDEMSKYYDQWDNSDMVYRGERKADLQDAQAAKRGEPVKMIIPLTFSQIQTFVAFGHATFNQKDYYFETVASGMEDERPGQIASAVLEQNLYRNRYRSVQLIQHLTDIGRFGLGVTKETWVNETCPVTEMVVDQAKMAQARAGMVEVSQPPMIPQTTVVSRYMGNKIVNVSPYRFFPDVRLPISRWSEGEFAGDEIEESRMRLQEMEAEGTIAGLDEVAQMPDEAFTGRRLQFLRKDRAIMASQANPEYYLLTEVQIRLNPAKTEIDDGVFLDSTRDYNCIYIIWVLNDSRIVRISEAGYDHEEFGYNVAQLFEDQNHFVNFSLADILQACQDTATWFLNSHITSVRKNIFNQFVVDPSGIEVDDIIKRYPFIRTKPGRAGSGVDTWIKQLQTNDVTQAHVNDVGVLSGMAKEASGINETLLGQFSPGRRSAKEAGNVANFAASRLMMILSSIWESSQAPMGRKMLSNLRQGLDENTMVKVYGQLNVQEDSQPDLPGLPPPLFRLIGVSKSDLVGNYDLAIFNGTLPSQRQATAYVLKEILSDMQKDPRLVLMVGLDPKLIFFEMLTLLNIRNVKRFQLTPERLQQLTALAQPPGNPGSPGGTRPGVNSAQRPNGQPNPSAGVRPVVR